MRDLEIALQNYYKQRNPEELDGLLITPNTLLESKILSDNDDLTLEAVIILDSLNSYNNGIINQELELDLISIKESSPFYSWRCAALGIKEFNNNNRQLMINHLNEIKDNSPVKKIIPHMIDTSSSNLYSFNKELNEDINSLKEVISNNLIDMYSKSVKLVYDDLNNLDCDLINNITLTIIEESIINIPLDLIQTSIVPFVGLKESIRLMAIGTAFEKPINSIQYWFCYITESNFKNIEDSKLQCLIKIILDIIKALIREKFKFNSKNEKLDFIDSSELFFNNMSKIVKYLDDTTKNPLTRVKKALTFYIKSRNESLNNIITTKQGELF